MYNHSLSFYRSESSSPSDSKLHPLINRVEPVANELSRRELHPRINSKWSSSHLKNATVGMERCFNWPLPNSPKDIFLLVYSDDESHTFFQFTKPLPFYIVTILNLKNISKKLWRVDTKFCEYIQKLSTSDTFWCWTRKKLAIVRKAVVILLWNELECLSNRFIIHVMKNSQIHLVVRNQSLIECGYASEFPNFR